MERLLSEISSERQSKYILVTNLPLSPTHEARRKNIIKYRVNLSANFIIGFSSKILNRFSH
jgi:hypothetical protein